MRPVPPSKRYTVYYPGGVTRLEALYIFSALAEPSSTKLVRRPRHRSANYSTLWLRLHLRLRLRTRTPAALTRSVPLPVLAARPRPGEYPGAPIPGSTGRFPTAVERVRRPAGSPTAPFGDPVGRWSAHMPAPGAGGRGRDGRDSGRGPTASKKRPRQRLIRMYGRRVYGARSVTLCASNGKDIKSQNVS